LRLADAGGKAPVERAQGGQGAAQRHDGHAKDSGGAIGGRIESWN
jgi:hypothetical protein